MKEYIAKYYLGKSPEESVEAQIKDGWITCSLPLYEKVVFHYKNSHSMQKTADELGISKSEVHYIIARYK